MSDQQLVPQPGEHREMHRAFLLWLMQAPEKRSIRGTAKAVGYSEAMVRRWLLGKGRSTEVPGWEARAHAIGAGGDTLAARYYAANYHRVQLGKEVAIIAKNMAIQYVSPDAAAPGLASGPPLAPPPPLSDRAMSIQVHDVDVAEEKLKRRHGQMHQILDATTGRIAEALKAGKLRVQVGDLLTVTRLRRELEAGNVAAGTGNPMATSVRVEKAAEKGEDVLAALVEDHDELGLILGALATAVEVSNVVPFPGGRQVPIKEAQG